MRSRRGVRGSSLQVYEEQARPAGGRAAFRSPYVWAFTTYFAEGFPYTLIRIVTSVFFRDMKVSLEAIGLTSLFGIPWVLKFLWGPHVDQYGTKRQWMLAMQFALVVLVSSTAFLTSISDGVQIIALLLFFGAFLAATHDIAIDGYYMEALDEKGQARFVGYRVLAYRLSMMTGTGVIVTIGATANWMIAYLSSGALLAGLFVYHLFFLPKVETEKEPFSSLLLHARGLWLLVFMAVLVLATPFLPRPFPAGWDVQIRNWIPLIDAITPTGWIGLGLLAALLVLGLCKERIRGLLLRDKDSFYSRAFMAYMDREKMGIALAFIILMRTGEAMLSSMAAPFMVDLGIKTHYGWISGGVGLPCSIAGALLGGWVISRYELRRTVWPFLLAQNLTNIVYMLLALYLHSFVVMNTGKDMVVPLGAFNLCLVASVHGFDQFAGGLGNSVLTFFLMRTCLPEFKAAHFAVGTGLMSVSAVLSGAVSGFLAGWLGYGYFFGVSFVLSIPGMALIPYAPFLDSENLSSRPGHDTRDSGKGL